MMRGPLSPQGDQRRSFNSLCLSAVDDATELGTVIGMGRGFNSLCLSAVDDAWTSSNCWSMTPDWFQQPVFVGRG